MNELDGEGRRFPLSSFNMTLNTLVSITETDLANWPIDTGRIKPDTASFNEIKIGEL